MKANWIKTTVPVKDEDNLEELHMTKSEEVRHVIKCHFCIQVCLVNLEAIESS